MVDRSRRRFFSRRQPSNQPRMPWVAEDEVFTDLCTRCNKCVEACETQIIAKGDGGFPSVDFSRGECTFCYQCADACPEPLFRPQSEQPWTVKALITEACLAHKNIECRSCGDMCEEQAIRFRLQAGGVAQPQLDTESCTGCGACVAVCPTSAIKVTTETQMENKQ